jgi:hypothetical protein
MEQTLMAIVREVPKAIAVVKPVDVEKTINFCN